MKTALLLCALVVLAIAAKDKTPPLAIFHGFGDQCSNPGMSSYTKQVGEALGSYTACIEVGNGASDSITMDFHVQAEKACEGVRADPNFSNTEISVMGLSQGGLLARYIVEECELNNATAVNLVTFGAPHTGVSAIPHCFHGPICYFPNLIAKYFIYWDMVQHSVGPAGYFRDPAKLDTYLKKSVFLPELSNQVNTTSNSDIKDRFGSLRYLFLGMFSRDTMIYPKESAWFYELQKDGSVLEVQNTDLYKEDLLGLQQLIKKKAVDFHVFKGDHLRFSISDVKTLIIPNLK